MARRAIRSNPKSLIIITGCYSQVEPEAFDKMEGVHCVLGNKEKGKIPYLLPQLQKYELPRIQVSDIQEESTFWDVPLYSFRHHTRGFLKIQDGCDGRCSYCIVPYARGPSRSLPPDKVIEHLNVLKEKGFKEVVLTGIHVGAYGLDLIPPIPLKELLRRVEKEETPGRIRLSSIEPMDFSPDLISLLSQSKKICPHLHIPIQSGEDEILSKMNRNYDCSFVSDLIRELHRRIPKLAIGADVIVGFPGETEEKFHRTYEFIRSRPFSYLHVFPFSKRRGTPASLFPQQVDGALIKKRTGVMRELGNEKRRAFYQQFLLQELHVLVEDRREGEKERWRGLSRNYIPVLLADANGSEGGPNWINQELAVRVTGLEDTHVIGKVERQHG
jgi:threonylcarbamoyladenosine tRNA methylthiotransferase MtaB